MKTRAKSRSKRPPEPTPGAPLNQTPADQAATASAKASRRTGVEARISPRDRVALYAVRAHLTSGVKQACGLQLPFVAYYQDPFFAQANPELAFDEKVFVDWEPGLADGPTSSRFAVVDYNADTGILTPPAEWDEKHQQFVSGGQVMGKNSANTFQFHQVSVWALLQRALAFFEEGNGLGRRVPWAFEGNRLIVVPHAGYGENAFYDRSSKSLQFYYFGSDTDPVYTCLSADIVNHEFGHAVLDGVRPFYNESSSVQTAAFHEFMGDLTAILLTLRNNAFRQHLAETTEGDIGEAKALSSIAEQFGHEVSGRPYLRTALNKDKLSEMANETSPHRVSQVLTGAMFDVLMRVAQQYQGNGEEPAEDDDQSPNPPSAALGASAKAARIASPKQAFWRAADRLHRMAIQPLDLLPPVEVTFRDYARAVCRAEQLSNPLDPHGYYDLLIDVFRQRGILSAEDEQELKQPQYLYDQLRLSVPHAIDDIARSRATAYRFLDDNREDLLIPANRDFFVADLYDANKLIRQGARMPRQIILEYVWREDVFLDGTKFGQYHGQTTTMLCGGTLVFDDNGIVLSKALKPGSSAYGGKRQRGGLVARAWQRAIAEGQSRRQALLETLATQIQAGRVGGVVGSANGLLGTHLPPIVAEGQDGAIQFRLSPHLHLSEAHHLDEETGARSWEISC